MTAFTSQNCSNSRDLQQNSQFGTESRSRVTAEGVRSMQVEAKSPVTLDEILAARDKKVARQAELLATYGGTLISFGLNIPGPHKVSVAFAWAFEQEKQQVKQAIQNSGWRILFQEARSPRTGYEGFISLDAESLAVKHALVAIEEGTALGRLFDIDVLRADGTKVSREDLGQPGRKCLLCDQPAFVCARSRAHSVDELLTHIRRTIEEARLAQALRFALVEELDTTPKPGLVDQHDNGAHTDMDHTLFLRSIDAVVPHLTRMGMAGYDWQGDLSGLFPVIQRIGVEAEQAMFCATGGVNTHKGAIFTLGILAASVGYLDGHPETGAIDGPIQPAHVSQTATLICRDAMAAQFSAMDEKKRQLDAGADIPLTHGERIYCELGIRGIREEAARGFPTVFTVALPRLQGAGAHDQDTFNTAKLTALLAVMSQLDDSNVIARANMSGLTWVKQTSQTMLSQLENPESPDLIPQLSRLNALFIQRNISPGGAADLLGAALFIHALFQSGGTE